jgi:anti-sigma factor RsiW
MCDFGDKLIAWLDGELSRSEASEIEHHVHGCEECWRRIASYKEMSAAIISHCDARLASQAQASLRLRWKSVLVLAAAAAVAFLLVRHASVERRLSQAPLNEVVHAAVPKTLAKSLLGGARASLSKPVHKHRSIRVSRQTEPQEYIREGNWVPAESAVQITIPAESMFAPGAVPLGASFSAELILAADGSAQSIRLRP